MKKCTGSNTREWDANSIFNVTCKGCGTLVEFFKDEIQRKCPQCRKTIFNNRNDFGCGQWCSSSSSHTRNLCPKFKIAKDRYYGHKIA